MHHLKCNILPCIYCNTNKKQNVEKVGAIFHQPCSKADIQGPGEHGHKDEDAGEGEHHQPDLQVSKQVLCLKFISISFAESSLFNVF